MGVETRKGSKAIRAYWLRDRPDKAKIRNVGYISFHQFGGSYGIKYQYLTKVVNKSDNDWMSFVQDKSGKGSLQSNSDGLTETGQLLLQQVIESYVYAMLGARARTRFKIVGARAKSSQTQCIFHKIVRDTIAQNDDSTLISNMQTAISTTNVKLDMTITPGVTLIPSKMVILDKRVAGYNNVLTIATKDMSFGQNK